ncbi:MAG: ASCH domain-containing protein [Planctomycetota bacterium]
MLIRTAILKRIQSGEITLAFRRWKRATVKAGGTLNTAIGQLSIDSLKQIPLEKITAKDAKSAGFESRQQLLDELSKREGDVYRVGLSFAGPDPRIALRESANLSKDELDEIVTKLQKMDSRSKSGPWILDVMQTIADHPKTLAATLAEGMGREKKWLKPNVRKLKAMGLTISHDVGYSLSPRGKKVFKRLKKLSN